MDRKIQGRERSVYKLSRSANGACLRSCLVIGTCAADWDPRNEEVRCETGLPCSSRLRVIQCYAYFDYGYHRRIRTTLSKAITLTSGRASLPHVKSGGSFVTISNSTAFAPVNMIQ